MNFNIYLLKKKLSNTYYSDGGFFLSTFRLQKTSFNRKRKKSIASSNLWTKSYVSLVANRRRRKSSPKWRNPRWSQENLTRKSLRTTRVKWRKRRKRCPNWRTWVWEPAARQNNREKKVHVCQEKKVKDITWWDCVLIKNLSIDFKTLNCIIGSFGEKKKSYLVSFLCVICEIVSNFNLSWSSKFKLNEIRNHPKYPTSNR